MLLDDFPYTTWAHSEEILNTFRKAASKAYFNSDIDIYAEISVSESNIKN